MKRLSYGGGGAVDASSRFEVDWSLPLIFSLRIMMSCYCCSMIFLTRLGSNYYYCWGLVSYWVKLLLFCGSRSVACWLLPFMAVCKLLGKISWSWAAPFDACYCYEDVFGTTVRLNDPTEGFVAALYPFSIGGTGGPYCWPCIFGGIMAVSAI